jgi:homoserine kinase type II
MILENCNATQKSLANLISHRWPEIVIHCDYHPGNLKFEGEQIVGIFDFDWSKIDLRCFDFALASWYFFTGWTGDEDGVMRLGDFRLFFNVYQDSLSVFPNFDPLTQEEIDHLGMMISAANLYVMSWTLRDFYAKDVEVIEYLGYLRHSINFINWYENIGLELIQNTLVERRY